MLPHQEKVSRCLQLSRYYPPT